MRTFKRVVALLLMISFVMVDCVAVKAEPKHMPDGGVFDADFYKTLYSGISPEINMMDDMALYEHYKNNAKSGYLPYATAGFTFSTYSDVPDFLDNLTKWDAFFYGVDNWKNVVKVFFGGLWQTDPVFGTSNDNPIDVMAKDFMTDPVKSKALLKDLVDEMSSTNTPVTFSTERGVYKDFETLAKEAKYASADHRELFGTSAKALSFFRKIISATEGIESLFVDYQKNIEYLNIIESSLPAGGVLKKTVKELKAEYEENFARSLESIFVDSVVAYGNVITAATGVSAVDLGTGLLDALSSDDMVIGVGDYVVKKAMTSAGSAGYGLGQLAWKYATLAAGEGDTVKEVDKIVMSNSMWVDSIAALKLAENAYLNNKTQKNLSAFVAAFQMTKSLTLLQYENMYSYYSRNGMSDRANAIYAKISDLNDLEAMKYMANIMSAPAASPLQIPSIIIDQSITPTIEMPGTTGQVINTNPNIVSNDLSVLLGQPKTNADSFILTNGVVGLSVNYGTPQPGDMVYYMTYSLPVVPSSYTLYGLNSGMTLQQMENNLVSQGFSFVGSQAAEGVLDWVYKRGDVYVGVDAFDVALGDATASQHRPLWITTGYSSDYSDLFAGKLYPEF